MKRFQLFNLALLLAAILCMPDSRALADASSLSAGGVCQVGDVLAPGESCTYPGTDAEFSVLSNGSGHFLFSTAGTRLEIKNTTINGQSYTLVAGKLASGSWEIEELADSGNTPVTTWTPVCDRTPQVRDAIVAAVPDVSTCGDVTEAHLAAITNLNLGYKSITLLKSRDFSGLSSLETLFLHNNYSLTSLPEDMFDGLSSLKFLNMQDNSLTSLPEGVFDGLSSLVALGLYGNQLSTLPEDVFDELSSLTRLFLSNNELTSLSAGVFSGLFALQTIQLGGNTVDPLPLTVSLEQDGDGQFKAVAPTGAPFDMVLPLNVTNGTITGGAITVTIPKGSVESEPLTATRTQGTTSAVTVDIGTLPGLPANHQGYALVKSTDLPLEVISSSATGGQAATDFNGDGKTDFVDFFLFADAYGGTDPRFDLDGSGTVDFVDFFKFVDAFGS